MTAVMLPQYIDISTRAVIHNRTSMVMHTGAQYRIKLAQQWMLGEVPGVIYDDAFDTWIIDPYAYDPAISSQTIFYRLGMIPLEDHLNRLMRRKSPSWTDQPLVQIDQYWFMLGPWRWKYDTPRNKLLMCVDGPAQGDYTETLI